jgi:glc operon protein GlcG
MLLFYELDVPESDRVFQRGGFHATPNFSSPMKHYLRNFVVLAGLAMIATALRAQVVTKTSISLELAKKVAAKAEAEAIKNKWTMVIVVVDDGGNLVYLEKMDGTQLGSLAVAEQKALTALKFKRPTKVFEDGVSGGRNALLSVPGVIAIEGGIPLVQGDSIIGAIGVSGMKSNEDGVVAQAGAAVVAP